MGLAGASVAVAFVLGMLFQGERHARGLGRLIPHLVKLDVIVKRLVQYAAAHPQSDRLIGEAGRVLAALWSIVEGSPAEVGPQSPPKAKGPQNGTQEQGEGESRRIADGGR